MLSPQLWRANSLALVMVEQMIVQTAITSIETFDATNSNFKAWTEAIKNTAQISGQNTICIAFSKLTGSPLLTANRLKTRSSNLMLADLKMNCPCNNLLFHQTLMQPRLSPI